MKRFNPKLVNPLAQKNVNVFRQQQVEILPARLSTQKQYA